MTRRASRADVGWLVDMEQRCFGAEAWGLELLSAAVDSGQVLIAPDGIGYAVVRVVDDVADLDRIAVDAHARGNGVGRVLLAAATTDASQRGAHRMLLEVAVDNESAVALYRSAGFVEIHRRRGYYPGGRDAIVMELGLSGSDHATATVE